MPQAFAGDRTEGQRTEKVYKKNFRYVKKLSFAERFKLPTVAPIIYGGFGVAGQGDNLLHGNDILILAEQFGVIVVHLPENIFWQFLRELRHIVTAVPSPRCGIEFRIDGSLLKVRPDILFLDFVAACFPARVLAGDFTALEQVQGGGFADVANAIQLILRDYNGNGALVDYVFFHDNTLHISYKLCRYSNCSHTACWHKARLPR